MSKPILEFKHPYRFLSNFWPVPHGIKHAERVYPTVEHAYQAAKRGEDAHKDRILECLTPSDAKLRGKLCRPDPGWETVRVHVMAGFLRQKFAPGTVLAMQLLGTDDRLIEEGNDWGDRFWGVSPPGSGQGQNRLGNMLMLIRSELRGDET